MIKKIPIKGISRDPSGQISAEGFCAESLNIQLDMGEVAPAILPKAVTDAAGNPVSVQGDVLFIHKGINYENLVYRDGSNIHFTAVLPKGTERTGVVYSGLLSDEEVNDVNAVGNTLIVSTSRDMYYILWKEGAYNFLGNRIPVPDIYFRIGNMSALRQNALLPDISEDTVADDFADYGDGFDWKEETAPVFKHESVGDKTEFGSLAKRYAFDSSDDHGFWNKYMEAIWSAIDRIVSEKAAEGKAVFPVFVRYAVRLYDGTCYAQSIPVLLGADIERFVDVKGIAGQNYVPSDEDKVIWTWMAAIAKSAEAYSVVMSRSAGNVFSGWEDIVTGVDIFVSPQIKPIQRNAARLTVELLQSEMGPAGSNDCLFVLNRIDIDPYYTIEHQEDMVLGYQDTYLAKSFTTDEFENLSGDVVLEDINFNSDYIMAQEALKETPQSMHHTVGSRLFNYNKRLLVTDAEQSLSHGYVFLHSVKWSNSGPFPPLRFVYYLRGENGENVVICRDENGNAQVTPKSKAILSGSSTVFGEIPCAWLSYPDSRCYKIDVYRLDGSQITMASFRTKTLDRADVAYAFIGFGKEVEADIPVQLAPSDESATYRMPNVLVVSKPNNPFVFPATDAVTFTAGEILNLAVATKPLSEGQFGQFPLYVFTDEGVYALSVDAEGGFKTSHPVTRDILLGRDALVGIEQGVFFAAARGLLLLQGSVVTNVSSQMDGQSDPLDGELLRQVEERFLGTPVENPPALRTFLSGCLLAYDYANSRIIVLNPEYKSQYVYKFDTQSWHRLQVGNGKPVRVLNSFPEAQITMREGSRQSVLDFSVLAENADSVAMKGVVYTRDLDLDLADIYKAISRLKVRGRYADGHVKWQLQGSNDGMNYTIVHSLRGPSWKWYRIALVTMLEKDERISYVELECAPRFTDKLR